MTNVGYRDEPSSTALMRWLPWVGLSAVLHLVLAVLLIWGTPDQPPRPHKARQVKVVALKGSKWKSTAKSAQALLETALAADEAAKRREEERKKKEEEEKVDLKKLSGQIVNLPPSPDSQPPPDARYLSQYNTRTEKESRSRHQDDKYQNPTNEPSRVASSAPPRGALDGTELSEEQTPQPTPPQPEKSEQQPPGPELLQIPSLDPRDRLALKLNPGLGQLSLQEPSDKLVGNALRLRLRPGKESAGPTAAEPSRKIGSPHGGDEMKLLLDEGVISRIAGTPANDHLDDVEEGDGTFLNSRSFRYASFFNRLHQTVSQHWYPRRIIEERDPSGNVYGFRDRVTVVNVVLDSRGSLIDLSVLKPSGIPALDNEAMYAFRRASPFPNPPTALLDTGGRVEFRFGFYVTYDRFGIGRF